MAGGIYLYEQISLYDQFYRAIVIKTANLEFDRLSFTPVIGHYKFIVVEKCINFCHIFSNGPKMVNDALKDTNVHFRLK